jgi:hypothetical protein
MPQVVFSSPGVNHWNVPKNVEQVDVELRGGGSGTINGGLVLGRMKVKDDWSLWILTGEEGQAPSGAQGGDSSTGGGGAGGDGTSGNDGGRGGGGASAIRVGDANGTIKAVAGGAGGHSGDGGTGGVGGAGTGGHGNPASTSLLVGNATGGTQAQGGKGGNTVVNVGYSGSDALNGTLTQGGRGGQVPSGNSDGGGGGGGGYHAGGGGQAAALGNTPGGGGGGGSNYTGGLSSQIQNVAGGGTNNDGRVVISWVDPGAQNQPPTTPSDVKIDGHSESAGMGTKSTGKVEVSAIVKDPDKGDRIRLRVYLSKSTAFNHSSQTTSDPVDDGKRATVKLVGLDQQTQYHGRLVAVDKNGKESLNYNSISFWTNRQPSEPTLNSPPDNGTANSIDNVTFDWTHHDPDPSDSQSAFRLRWRRAAQGVNPPGDWTQREQHTSESDYTLDAGTLKPNLYYEWQVRTRDEQGSWGPLSNSRTLFILGLTTPPRLLSPIADSAAEIDTGVTLHWQFRDPNSGNHQANADVRIRVGNTSEWTTLFGDLHTATNWVLPAGSLMPGFRYEWAARTYRTSDGTVSDWSDSSYFRSIDTIGSTGSAPQVIDATPSPGLGTGTHRAFIYDRGGRIIRGELTPLNSVTWGRKRDDIGSASVTVSGFGDDCGELLRNTHTWINELVIFRDGVRVFEGPITLLTDSVDGFTIQADDVMRYVYRRIMRQGYNDSYHLIQGQPEGLLTVVRRASLIIADALARDDPNVLAHLTPIMYDDDARQSRVVADYAKTAWEEVDDMAANAGLDYSTIGRRIILNDTHRPIGRLPEMRGADFTDPPVISEYGMQLADYYAVTNGTGEWGAVEQNNSPYGGVEILVSSFSENSTDEAQALTPQALSKLRAALTDQAKRGIVQRYPAPYVVRVPDNSQLLPSVQVGINQLVPGVWIPLRAQGTAIEIAQWQKLDAMQVEEVKGNEKVTVTMSPAPGRGADPDADPDAEETAT